MPRLFVVVIGALAFATISGCTDAPVTFKLAAHSMALEAKSVCETPAAIKQPEIEAACAGDPTGGFAAFKTQLLTQFAATSGCKGVKLVTQGAGVDELHVNYVPGQGKYRWRLFRPNLVVVREGAQQESLQEIARQVCRILLRRGADVPDEAFR